MLIGEATRPMDSLTTYPNVHWLGYRTYARIPDYGSQFDVAIMPWLDNEWIRYANPIKLKEYLALGLPVVTTEFAEIDRYRDVVRVARNHAQFIELIRRTLSDGGPADPAARRAVVATASWQSRADELIELAEGEPRIPPLSRVNGAPFRPRPPSVRNSSSSAGRSGDAVPRASSRRRRLGSH